MKKILLAFMVSAALVGCKTDIITTVTTDDLLSDPQKIVQGNVQVEVLACNDYEDSRNESRSLVEAKAKVSQILSNSEYVECYNQKFKSFAVFKTPIVVGSAEKRESFIDGDIYLTSGDGAYLSAMLHPDLIKKLDAEKKSLSSFGKIDLNIVIGLKKGDTPIPDLVWEGVYLSDDSSNIKKYPHIMKRFDGVDTEMMFISFSDVANARLMNGDVSSVAWYPEALIKNLSE